VVVVVRGGGGGGGGGGCLILDCQFWLVWSLSGSGGGGGGGGDGGVAYLLPCTYGLKRLATKLDNTEP
jgi:hypothetical protein